MKKLILFSLAAITLLWIGCGQQADVNTMLKNAETKDKVFSAILEDHELMTEFMNKMKSNEHTMMMMLAPEEADRAISTICFCATLREETRADGSIEGSIIASVSTTRRSRSDSTRNPKRARSIPSVRFS